MSRAGLVQECLPEPLPLPAALPLLLLHSHVFVTYLVLKCLEWRGEEEQEQEGHWRLWLTCALDGRLTGARSLEGQ